MVKRSKSIFKIIAAVIFLAVIFLCAFHEGRCDEPREKSIAVLLSRSASPYAMALSGFRSALTAAGVKYSITLYDLEGSPEEGHRAMLSIKKTPPDLVLSVGSTATEVAYNEGRRFPVIFTMVQYPEDSGFTRGRKAARGNFSGVSLDVSPWLQFETLRRIAPWVKRIGVLYDPSDTSSAVAEARAAARDHTVELIAVPVYSPARVPEVLNSLSGRIDALWSVADSTVFNSKSIKYVISFALRNRIPFIGISSYFVREGALLSVSPDYLDVGRQAGEMAAKVLKGAPVESVPVARPRRVASSINLRTAWRIGLNPSASELSNFNEVLK